MAYLRHEMDIVREHLLTYKHFLLARHHLLQMSWVGLTETFDQSIRQLTVFWGLCSDMIPRKVNANVDKWYIQQKDNIVSADESKHNEKEQLTEKSKLATKEELQDIAKHNIYDIQLYALAKVLYLQQDLVFLATTLDEKEYQCSRKPTKDHSHDIRARFNNQFDNRFSADQNRGSNSNEGVKYICL
ncbi:hypothetical protein RFI_25995 [Reticulomyxa filosa]|uniref:Uncharacterized protein n=1 Tax=Reticulomyxa filosa TaxID=46433 RepID=X6MCM8_RETFI|nr:hypothetical protein RFI_25995 [Reticulomyxa filosa]|eukprot:ETO11381.1 hypothetical protein RFI_25995 [Reticulomyxa filosa]